MTKLKSQLRPSCPSLFVVLVSAGEAANWNAVMALGPTQNEMEAGLVGTDLQVVD